MSADGTSWNEWQKYKSSRHTHISTSSKQTKVFYSPIKIEINNIQKQTKLTMEIFTL